MFRQFEGRFQTASHPHTLRGKARLPADHDIAAPRQGTADGLKGLAAHEDRLAHGQALEMREVRRQIPGQGIVVSDHIVVGRRDDQRDREIAHTATGAAMCGWGS